ncbi:helix-turn-helix transcriptional regulator [Sciscionella marina]|uniref:helix-turn-helix transcriptional regulator n=1 Tax=Sciscionella marina TaxID=508770 RepID=UPI0003691BF9|nr:WYL domain-containing protein [Sciscionella marina]
MSTTRAERLVNLVICLLATRQYLPAERIRGLVAGYGDAPSDEAFSRMFERDKAELRDLGVPLETGRNSIIDPSDGYRIARRDYELSDIELEPDEAAAVALAARLWDSPQLTGAASGALRKLRAAGVDVEDGSGAVQPKVRTNEPSFAPLLAAVNERKAVRFPYRRPGSTEPAVRSVEPWGVVSWRGRWYVVGHDRDRNAARCFRLSRVVGEVRAVGLAGAVVRPDGVNLLDYVTETGPDPVPVSVWVAEGRAHGVRRKGSSRGQRTIGGRDGEVFELELAHLESSADWLAGHGPDVLVLEPDTLRKNVVNRWLAAIGGKR